MRPPRWFLAGADTVNIAEQIIEQLKNRRIGSLDELGRQVALWQAERNSRAFKIHWSFTVATAELKLKKWYEQVNEANKTVESKN